MKKVMLLHGVNHNMFGKRNPKAIWNNNFRLELIKKLMI